MVRRESDTILGDLNVDSGGKVDASQKLVKGSC